MNKDRIIYLLERYRAGQLTISEREELLRAAAGTDESPILEAFDQLISADAHSARQVPIGELRASIQVVIDSDKVSSVPFRADVHRVHFLRTAWFKYAAAIVILLGIGIYFYFTNIREKPQIASVAKTARIIDIAPGTQKAILTLTDGTMINLDSAANGQLAIQNGTSIFKKIDGQVEYASSQKAIATVAYNTMSTPRGGQYQLRLQDGTKVWLNAASSITYPTTFDGKERKVHITGEVYFEVAQDKLRPFQVDANGWMIGVLGTHFNVHAYQDEEEMSTTLLEGLVKVRKHNEEKLLSPGEQAAIRENVTIRKNVDLEQVMAWKNGVFNFNRLSLEAVMHQISNWYGVDIIYEKDIPKTTFIGGMKRNLNLSEVLEFLQASGIHFRLTQDKKLFIGT